MESIKDKVAIIGMGCTKFGERWDAGLDDLAIEAAYEAYEDAGIGPNDIQACWYGSVTQPMVGIGCTHLAGPLKLHGIPMTRVENWCTTGHEALRNACFGVACGMYDMVLALGVEKLKDTGFPGLGAGRGMSPVLEARRTAPGSFGMIATRYFYAYGLSPQEGKRVIGKIAVKNHHNGTLNPKAQFGITIADWMKKRVASAEKKGKPIPTWKDEWDFLHDDRANPMIAWPLRLFDCSPITDGAAAVLLVAEEIAHNFTGSPIHIIGSGQASDYALHDRKDLTSIGAARLAGQSAYEMAGVKPDQIQLAEVHDCFTIAEIVAIEDLGFFKPGEGHRMAEEGVTALNGSRPINSSGGLKSKGHPVGASGVGQSVEIWKQMRGEAGERQVPGDLSLALTHNVGATGQTCVVHIYERRA